MSKQAARRCTCLAMPCLLMKLHLSHDFENEFSKPQAHEKSGNHASVAVLWELTDHIHMLCETCFRTSLPQH